MVETQVTTTFVMVGAREVLQTDAVFFEQQVIAIEKAVGENPGLSFDLAKTLIESTCKTILKDRGHEFDNAWDLPRLLKETVGKLQLVPDGLDGATDVAASLKKTIGGLQTAIQGICELRNTQGFASHGKDAYSKQLDIVQAQLVARAADVIVNFLFRAHRHYPGDGPTRRLIYRELTEFNEWIDEQNEIVRIFALEYKPSEVLFGIDPEAYRGLLNDYETEDKTEDQPEDKDQEGDTAL
jgi:hypothetical protein